MRSEAHKRLLEHLHGSDPRTLAKYLSTYLSTAVLSRQVFTCRKIDRAGALQRTARMAEPPVCRACCRSASLPEPGRVGVCEMLCPRATWPPRGMLEASVLVVAVVSVSRSVQAARVQQRGACAGRHSAGPAAAARAACVPGNLPRPCSPVAPAPQASQVGRQTLKGVRTDCSQPCFWARTCHIRLHGCSCAVVTTRACGAA